MKIAIISDIHGNIDALERVVSDCRKIGVDKYVFLGDYVGYYYYPEKVLDRIFALDAIFLKGNHEMLLEDLECGSITATELAQKYGLGHSIAFETLSHNQRRLLYSLPENIICDFDGIVFSFSHANPWDNRRYIYPDTIVEDELTENIDHAFFGHSHYQFIKNISRNRFICNVGSVGQNRERGGIANWVLYDTQHVCLRCMSTFYDVNNLRNAVVKIDGVESYNYKVLVRGN